MEIKTIDYYGVPLIVHYKVDGKYYPATYLQPAEYPEIYIEEIYVENTNIYNLFLEPQLDEIYELVNNKLEI